MLHREGPQGEGADEAGLHPASPERLDRSLGHPCRSVAGDQQPLGIVAVERLGSLLGGLHSRVLLVEHLVVGFEIGLVEEDRRDEVPAMVAIAKKSFPLGMIESC